MVSCASTSLEGSALCLFICGHAYIFSSIDARALLLLLYQAATVKHTDTPLWPLSRIVFSALPWFASWEMTHGMITVCVRVVLFLYL